MELATGKIRPGISRPPLYTSASRIREGFRVERHQPGAFAAEDICCLNHLVILHLDRAVEMDWTISGETRHRRIEPGQYNLVPAFEPYSLRSPDLGDYILVALEKPFFAQAAAEIGRPGNLSLVPVYGGTDALIREYVLALGNEVSGGFPDGGMYAETLAQALAARLIHLHAAQRSRPVEQKGGLSRRQLRHAVEYIHDHLAEDVSLERIAEAAGLSPFHFARQFRRATGIPPHDYVTRCRVERARDLLVRPGMTIADVAVQVGFCDQSHLARHYKRVYGLTPGAFARTVARRRVLPDFAAPSGFIGTVSMPGSPVAPIAPIAPIAPALPVAAAAAGR